MRHDLLLAAATHPTQQPMQHIRLTGDENFYYKLIKTIGLVATEVDFSQDFERIVQALAASKTIQSLGNPD